ncbi:mucin-2-like [Saccostrea cucullata]|uniref:mucin-2-like n=1 Tax=Saccostrea cuccullata TaxID=36930 RepID=UPI002ED1DEBB
MNLVLILIGLVTGRGTLFVGLLGFLNPSNRTFDGTCCGEENSTVCYTDCRLLFDITVIGLGQNETKSPLDTPVSGSKVISIPPSNEMKNPLSFSFQKWPGEVTILVSIYDLERKDKSLVDIFNFTFKYGKPELNYKNETIYGMRPQNETVLRLILRYNCDIFYFEKEDCSRFCLLDNFPCLNSLTGSTNPVTDWVYSLSTAKPSRERLCPTIHPVSGITQLSYINENTENCTNDLNEKSTLNTGDTTSTTKDPVTSPTKDPVTFTTKNPVTSTKDPVTSTTKDSVTISDMKTSTEVNLFTTTPKTIKLLSTEINTDEVTVSSTESLFISSSTSPWTSQVETTTEPMVSSSLKTKAQISLTPSRKTTKNNPPTNRVAIITTSIKPTTLKSSTQQNTKTSLKNTEKHPPTKVKVDISTTGPSLSLSTNVFSKQATYQVSPNIPDGGPKTIDDDVMHYWPAIVGGVLGIIAVIAVLGVFVYVRKLRAQQKKRQDIYNVNPQTWILETNENGTSGMSEIALETEEV